MKIDTTQLARTGLWRAFAGLVLVILISGMVFAPSAKAQSNDIVTLYSFTGGTDGARPVASVVLDWEDNIYGTTLDGGGSTACQGGCGTVFKLDKTGKETVLHSFGSSPDGANPFSGVVLDFRGNLYGTTSGGGGYGFGTVYKVDREGNETVLHSFSGPPDGNYPIGGLVLDLAGNLYGTTAYGGQVSVSCRQDTGESGCGVVFKLDPSGKETILHSFAGTPDLGAEVAEVSCGLPTTAVCDGAFPAAGLTWDWAGNLYGTTVYGGSDVNDTGTVFKIDPKTGNETVIYDLGYTDPQNPSAGVVLDWEGNIYGTTSFEGAGAGNGGNGAVYKIDPAGNLTLLHTFTIPPDGFDPEGSLVLDLAGSVYGTTSGGGAYPYGGTVFKLDKTGNETVLTFNGTDGAGPMAGLAWDWAGNLYGTTSGGGAYGAGTVFKIGRQVFQTR
ncbi:MAG: choice-of-anchor tandem repeat GloVer-containing protein [Candidatus Acidiferrales bacterium]